MKKNLYLLELAVRDLDIFGNPEPVQNEDSGWSHLFGTYRDAAKFVFNIVHGYTGERAQREIVKLKLSRYVEGGLDPNRKDPKGFHQWNFAVKFEGITLTDINECEINEKTHKKFVKDLTTFWKVSFQNIDKRMKSVIRSPRRKRK